MNIINASTLVEVFTQYYISIVTIWYLHLLYKENDSKKWFLIHFVFNFLISIFSLKDVILCFTDITMCMNDSIQYSSTLPVTLSTVLHVYHSLAYELKFSDIKHHLMMIPPCFYFVNYICRFPAVNLVAFIITGCPGGIDYGLLTLVKMNKLDYATEKQINIYIQLWLRMPLCLFTLSLAFFSWQTGITSIWTFIFSILIAWNGIYYMNDTLRSTYRRYYI